MNTVIIGKQKVIDADEGYSERMYMSNGVNAYEFLKFISIRSFPANKLSNYQF